MFRSIFVVIKFELLKSFKKVSFWLTSLLISLGILFGLFIPVILVSPNSSENKSDNLEVLFIDENSFLQNTSTKDGKFKYTKSQESMEQIKAKMGKGEVSNLLLIESVSDVTFWYTNSSKVYKQDLILDINQKILENKAKVDSSNQSTEIKLIKDLKTSQILTNNDKKSIISGISTTIGSFLFLVIFIFGSLFMNQIIVEKNTKVYEVILSSIDIKDFFVAKYLSFILRVLVQFATFLVSFFVPFLLLSPLLLKNTSPPSSSDIEISSSFIGDMMSVFTPLNVTIFLIFAILGIVLYTSLLSMIGASFNNYMEASNSSLSYILTTPIGLAMMFNGYFLENPNSFITQIVQLFPLTSPISVTTYIFSEFSWSKVVLSFVFLVLSIFVSFKIAIKIYLEGALSSGSINIKKFWKIIIS